MRRGGTACRGTPALGRAWEAAKPGPLVPVWAEVLIMPRDDLRPLFGIVGNMPRLDHNPKRPKGWTAEDSEIYEWFRSNDKLLRWLFDTSRRRGLIRFDGETKTWRGKYVD